MLLDNHLIIPLPVRMEEHINILPLHKWFDTGGFPLVISGPCSAESEEQVMQTAYALSKIPDVKVFRAGIWKPRSRPRSFEGVGNAGLAWLRRVKEETGLKVTVEVANPSHVEASLKSGIDILWIGARTVVNPFSVQEIADALKGVDIPVMVKNPVIADITLWIGAIERLSQSGINKIIAVHRGFSAYEKNPYRNAPLWEIPIELKQRLPNIPLLCDPSHIAGKTGLIYDISQKALDLAMDGLMIETHINPKLALSDARQQLTPQQLREIIARLTIRQVGESDKDDLLEEFRAQIDKIDHKLINVLAERMQVVEKIGHYKSDRGITILQIKRWRDIIGDRLNRGVESGLTREFLLKLLQLVHKASIQKQEEILNKKKN